MKNTVLLLMLAAKRKVAYPGVKALGKGEYELALKAGEHALTLPLQ